VVSRRLGKLEGVKNECGEDSFGGASGEVELGEGGCRTDGSAGMDLLGIWGLTCRGIHPGGSSCAILRRNRNGEICTIAKIRQIVIK